MIPLLSIVVPTKNRYYYLEYIVRYFKSIDSDRIELVIQDNSESNTNNDFLKFLQKIEDKRIRYAYVEEDLTIDINCDLAIKNATGEYITMIGDDDIFSKKIIEFTEIFKEEGLEAVLPIKASYTWPDVNPRLYGRSLSGLLKMTPFSGKRKKVDVAKELNNVLKLGAAEILDLPRIYHGIIKRDVLEKVYDQTGTYFPGPSPDMANAVALSKFVHHYEIIDLPLIVSGHSKTSGGGQGAEGRHFGEISKMRFLPKDTAANWTPEIPFYWSGFTIYGESAIQSLKRNKMEVELEKFNYAYLIACCRVFDTSYKKQIAAVLKKRTIAFKVKVLFYCSIVWVKRAMFHFKTLISLLSSRISSGSKKEETKNNIYEVVAYIDSIFDKRYS